METVRRKVSLRVLMNGTRVGVLTKLSTGALQFQYESFWVRSLQSVPLSLSLPLREEPYSGDVVIHYFDNLLPDNDGIRKALAQRMSLKNQEIFNLLEAIGRDCVGAVQLLPMDEEITESLSIHANPVSNAEITKILKNLKINPLGVSPDTDFRISIAGAQEKTAFLKLKNKWHLPQGSTPSSHIFKTQMGLLRESIDMGKSVENEWLCLEICKAFDLPTAMAEIEDFGDIRALVVERFDRKFEGRKILRFAQEDFCQALGVSSHKKYENEGGPGIVQIMKLLERSDNPSQDRYRFLKSQVVFWLLAAIDGHAKNFSLFLLPGGINLTPLYDVMSAHPPIQKKQISYQKAKLAMAVGEKRHYKVAEITTRHWLQTAKLAHFPIQKMEEIIVSIAQNTDRVIDQVARNLPDEFSKEVANPIFEGMIKGSKLLRS